MRRDMVAPRMATTCLPTLQLPTFWFTFGSYKFQPLLQVCGGMGASAARLHGFHVI